MTSKKVLRILVTLVMAGFVVAFWGLDTCGFYMQCGRYSVPMIAAVAGGIAFGTALLGIVGIIGINTFLNAFRWIKKRFKI